MFPIKDPDDDEEESNIDTFNRWGWKGTIFELANRNFNEIPIVLKGNLLTALNLLLYKKEAQDKVDEARREQNLKNKH